MFSAKNTHPPPLGVDLHALFHQLRIRGQRFVEARLLRRGSRLSRLLLLLLLRRQTGIGRLVAESARRRNSVRSARSRGLANSRVVADRRLVGEWVVDELPFVEVLLFLVLQDRLLGAGAFDADNSATAKRLIVAGRVASEP